MDTVTRFWSHVDKTGDCWVWTAAKDRYGYGRSSLPGLTTDLAHRISWHLAGNELEKGVEICHTCDNPPCVNPAHLFAAAHRDNMADMRLKGRGAGRGGVPARLRTSCNRGHPWPEFMYLNGGHRACRVCNREAVKRYLERKKAKAA